MVIAMILLCLFFQQPTSILNSEKVESFKHSLRLLKNKASIPRPVTMRWLSWNHFHSGVCCVYLLLQFLVFYTEKETKKRVFFFFVGGVILDVAINSEHYRRPSEDLSQFLMEGPNIQLCIPFCLYMQLSFNSTMQMNIK